MENPQLDKTRDRSNFLPIGSRHLTAMLLAIAVMSLAVPVLAVNIPPLLDYPNHLTRYWLIAGGAKLAPLAQMYAVDWSHAATNIGADLFVLIMSHVFPVTALGSFLVFAAAALPPLGAIALNRAVFGGGHWWHIAFVWLAWNFTLLAGFINFQISVGLALLGAALQPALGKRSGATVLIARSIIGTIVLVTHLFGFVFYVVLVAAIAFGERVDQITSWRIAVRRIVNAALAGATAIPPFLLFLLLGKLPSAPDGSVGGIDGSVGDIGWAATVYSKLTLFNASFASYAPRYEAVAVVCVAVFLLLLMRRSRLRYHTGLLFASAFFVLVSFVAPFGAFGGGFIVHRFPLMAALCLVAGVRPNIELNTWPGRIIPIALCLVVASRSLWIADIWMAREPDIVSVRRAVQHVPAGSAILPVERQCSSREVESRARGRFFFGGLPNYWSYAVLPVMWQRAFVPITFAAPGKQPLRALPPWDEISVDGSPWLPEHLRDSRGPKQKVLDQWRKRFNYVLELNADLENPAPLAATIPDLELVADEGFARLYRIRQ